MEFITSTTTQHYQWHNQCVKSISTPSFRELSMHVLAPSNINDTRKSEGTPS